MSTNISDKIEDENNITIEKVGILTFMNCHWYWCAFYVYEHFYLYLTFMFNSQFKIVSQLPILWFKIIIQ